MSSVPSGRYKSRLFNFLNKQSHSLKERYERSLRHVKVTTVWGAQILLYPVYLLAQSARFAGYQLQQAAKRGWLPLDESKPSAPQSPTSSADTPIQRVLSAVDIMPAAVAADMITDATDKLFVRVADMPSAAASTTQPITRGFSWRAIFQELLSKLKLLPLEEPTRVETGIVCVATHSSNGVTYQPQTDAQVVATQSESQLRQTEALSGAKQLVRGVASLLETHTLVLVTAKNEILDILTSEQQQKLLSRMSWEIADYWRHRRLTRASEQQFSQRVLGGVNERRVLPAVRAFWQVMAWVQTGPIAIAANLFQESALANRPQSALGHSELKAFPLSSLVVAPLSLIVKQLNRLDCAVAELETQGVLLPASELTSDLAYRSQALLQRLQHNLGKASGQGKPTDFSDASETENLGIYSLIRDAVDYFFGSRDAKLRSTSGSDQPKLTSCSTEELQLNTKPHLGVEHKSGSLQLVNQVRGESGIWKVPGLDRLKKAVSHISQGTFLDTGATADAAQGNRIQSLIWAAIDYFFGIRAGKFSYTGSPEQQIIFSNPQGEINHLQGHRPVSLHTTQQTNFELTAIEEPDPWLTLDDLFGESNAATPSPAAFSLIQEGVKRVRKRRNRRRSNKLPVKQHVAVGDSVESQILGGLDVSKISLQNSQLSSAQLIRRSRKASTAKYDKVSPVAVSDGTRDSQVKRLRYKSSSSITAPATGTELDYTPDWIETQATPTGYAKHPLELILGRLDIAMLWIEELVVKLWQWIRRLR